MAEPEQVGLPPIGSAIVRRHRHEDHSLRICARTQGGRAIAATARKPQNISFESAPMPRTQVSDSVGFFLEDDMQRHSVAAALGLMIAVLLTCAVLWAPNRSESVPVQTTLVETDGDRHPDRDTPSSVVLSVPPSFRSPSAPSSGAFVDHVIESAAMSEDAPPFGLPFEHYFLILTRDDDEPLRQFLTADAFGENIAEMERQASYDADARDLAQAYRQAAMRASRKNAAPLEITRLVCGIRTCMGEVVGGNDSAYAYWASEFMAEGGGDSRLRYSAVETEQGRSSLRFFLYVDGFLGEDTGS